MRKTYISRKEKIIISTVDLINEIGIKDLSIKEIAKTQNVTEASLYKHFDSKEQILLEVLDYYSKYDNYILNTLNNSKKSAKENVFTYFRLYAEYYESYPAITSILGSYDILLHDEKTGIKVKNILNTRTDVLRSLIERGQIDKNINASNITEILMGTFHRTIFIWRLNKFDFSLKEKTIELVSDILNAY